MKNNNYRMDAIHGNISDVIISFYNMSSIARKEGLLALEEIAEKVANLPLMVRIGINLVVDGTDPDIVQEILSNLVESEQLSSKEQHKEAAVIKTGIEAIQKGENPRILISKMASHLGFKAYYQYVDSFEYEYDKNNIMIFGEKYMVPENRSFFAEEIDSLLNDGRGMTPRKNSTSVSELVITGLQELVLQYHGREEIIGRPCSPEFLAGAMHVLPTEFILKIFNEKLVPDELIDAYSNDNNPLDVNVRRAEYLVDLIMGGDGAEFL